MKKWMLAAVTLSLCSCSMFRPAPPPTVPPELEAARALALTALVTDVWASTVHGCKEMAMQADQDQSGVIVDKCTSALVPDGDTIERLVKSSENWDAADRAAWPCLVRDSNKVMIDIRGLIHGLGQSEPPMVSRAIVLTANVGATCK